MGQRALLLTSHHRRDGESRAARLMEFFGVPYNIQNTIEFRSPKRASEDNERYRLIGAAQSFQFVVDRLSACDGLESQIHSIFLFSNGDPVALSKIVSELSGRNISVRRGAKTHLQWS